MRYHLFIILLFCMTILEINFLIAVCCYTGKAIQKSDGSTT